MAKSLAYMRLQRCRSNLEKTIKSDLVWFAKELNVDETVLTDSQFNELTNPKSWLTEDQKAGEMAKRLLDRVDLYPGALGEFVDILNKKPKKFRPLIDELSEKKLLLWYLVH